MLPIRYPHPDKGCARHWSNPSFCLLSGAACCGVFYIPAGGVCREMMTCNYACGIFLLLNKSLVLFSALSFLAYGAGCFFSAGLEREFVRYRMEWLRRMVGTLQIAAAFGLLGGLSQPWLGQAAAVGLTLMMLVAVGVRIKIRDTLWQTVPALFYLALNAYLAVAGF